MRKRYDRPRLIHQAHVRVIVEAPSLRDDSGKELRRLHDVANQHLRTLKTLGYEPSGEFITTILELKLDGLKMCECSRSFPGNRRRFFTTLSCWRFWICRLEDRRIRLMNVIRNGRAIQTKNHCRNSLGPLSQLSVRKKNRLCLNCLKASAFSRAMSFPSEM